MRKYTRIQYTYVFTCSYTMHIHHACTHTYMNVRTYTHICILIFTCVLHVYIYIYIYLHSLTYTFICVYIFTYTHMLNTCCGWNFQFLGGANRNNRCAHCRTPRVSDFFGGYFSKADEKDLHLQSLVMCF